MSIWIIAGLAVVSASYVMVGRVFWRALTELDPPDRPDPWGRAMLAGLWPLMMILMLIFWLEGRFRL